MSIRVFGLTGGIGSGKSLVASHFRVRGVPVVDADALARQVVTPGSDGLAEIERTFDGGVLAPDGSLDRPRVAALIFADESARRRLNAIVHPRVRALAVDRFAALEAADEPLACYEVPLLFENGLDQELRPVVVVIAPEAACVARVASRDSISRDQAHARIRAQMHLAVKARLADYVVDNGGPPEATRRQADRVLDTIARSLGLDPSLYPTP